MMWLTLATLLLVLLLREPNAAPVRPAPGGGSLVGMRSISRVGAGDVGMNAKSVRSFLADLRK